MFTTYGFTEAKSRILREKLFFFFARRLWKLRGITGLFSCSNNVSILEFFTLMKRDFSNFFGSAISSSSLKMINFYKTANCPSSSQLSAFQNAAPGNQESELIRIHINDCEFCAAEAEFYARFPQADEEAAVCRDTGIPAPLYQLAEALLGSRQKNFSLLKALLGDSESLKLEKA